MKKTINPSSNNKKAIVLFWAIVGIASLTAGYMYARKPAGQHDIKIIDTTDVQSIMAAGNAHLINVLSPKTYKDAHIKGSINIPLKGLSRTAKQLFDHDQTLIVYCASSRCDASHKAAQVLGRAGFKNVFVYEGGMKDWRDKNLPVAGPCKMRYLSDGECRTSKVCKVGKKKTAGDHKKKSDTKRKSTKQQKSTKQKPEKRIRRAPTKPTVKTENKGKKAKKTSTAKKSKKAKKATSKKKTKKATTTGKAKTTKKATAGKGRKPKSGKQFSPRQTKKQKKEKEHEQELRFSPIE